MDIQWSLVLFTALTGMGGCLFACVAADEFAGRAKQAAFPAAVVALAAAIVGGLASVTHLSHPGRIMGALSHPTSGIFVEAVLVGCLCVCVAVYLVLVKREASAGSRKAVAVVGAVLGVALSFMAGESYLMEARPNWCSQLLPLGYLLTALPEGIAAYLLVVAVKAKNADAAPYGKALLVSGALAAIGAAAYVVWAGPSDAAQWTLLAVAVAGAVVAAVCGALVGKKPGSLLSLAGVAVVGALVGAVAYRCVMWLVSEPVANLFLNVF